MKRIQFVLILLCLQKGLQAQYIYTIKADSVKITNSCDTAELIIENHTQTVPGFLFNKGRGRTEFRRGLLRMSDSIFVIGGDTLRINPWLQGGNRFGTTGSFGTLDNNHIDFYTNNIQQMRLSNTGNLLVGTNADDGYKVQINGLVSLKNNETSDIRTPRFQVLIGDESANGGSGVLFYGDQIANGPISIATGHANHFRKFYFQTAGQPGDNVATYNFTYNGNMGPALNIYNFIEGKSKLFLTGNGNLLLGAEADNGYKLAVNGTTYSSMFTNVPMPIGAGDEGPVRLRYSAAGEFVSFYYHDKDHKRGFIGSPGDLRPLEIFDSVGFSFASTPYVSIGTEPPLNARLSVTTTQGSTLDAFCASTTDGGYLSGLTVKASGNTVIGNNYFDFGSKLQVMGSAYIRDTLKMPNLVSQTDMNGYKPVVADASGNIYKMAGWNLPQINRTPVNDAGYPVQASDYFIAYTALSASRTVTLPAAAAMTNRIMIIKDESGAAGTYNIIINVVAGGTIDGAASKTIMVNYGSLEVYSNGSQWFVK